MRRLPPELTTNSKGKKQSEASRKREENAKKELKGHGFPIKPSKDGQPSIAAYEPPHSVGSPQQVRVRATPGEIFLRLLGVGELKDLCERTEAYINQRIPAAGRRKHTVTEHDMKNFFAILFGSALVNYRSWRDMFKEDEHQLFGNEFFQSLMGIQYFETLMRWSQVDIVRLTNTFNRNCKRMWSLGSDLSFDDDLDHFKGHGKIKRMPKKLAKHCLVEGGRFGIVLLAPDLGGRSSCDRTDGNIADS